MQCLSKSVKRMTTTTHQQLLSTSQSIPDVHNWLVVQQLVAPGEMRHEEMHISCSPMYTLVNMSQLSATCLSFLSLSITLPNHLIYACMQLFLHMYLQPLLSCVSSHTCHTCTTATLCPLHNSWSWGGLILKAAAAAAAVAMPSTSARLSSRAGTDRHTSTSY